MIGLGPLTLPLLAMFLGAVAWPGEWGGITLMPLSLILPALWTHAKNRWSAGLVGMAYHLAASRGLPDGAATYFGQGLPVGLVLWLATGLLIGIVYGLVWSKKPAVRVRNIPVLLFLLAVPPLGIVGWANPLTAAGWLFPGCGWWGLLACVAFMMILADLPKPRPRLIVFSVVSLLIVVVMPVAPAPERLQRFATGVDTYLPFDTNRRDDRAAYLRQYGLIDQVQAEAAPVVVLPESIAGRWDVGKQELWASVQSDLVGRTVLMGGSHRDGDEKLDNVLIRVSDSASEIVYRQRMPVPLAMWRPWATDGFRSAAWFDQKPVFELRGQTAAALICYEHLLVWPVLHAMLYRPNLLIGIGNVWWAKKTSLPAIQQAALTSWARLFNVQLVTAFNYGTGEQDDRTQPALLARP